MALLIQYSLLAAFILFFLWNIVCIAKKKIDAGVGVVWSVIFLALIAADAKIDFNHSALSDPTLLIALSVFLIIILCVAYSHELEIASLRKKNNELAMELALFRDEFEQNK